MSCGRCARRASGPVRHKPRLKKATACRANHVRSYSTDAPLPFMKAVASETDVSQARTKAPTGLAFMLRALQHKNYRLFFSGQSVSLIGTWMTRIATSWLVYRLT